jgi:hypothetical protein
MRGSGSAQPEEFSRLKTPGDRCGLCGLYDGLAAPYLFACTVDNVMR